MATAPSAVRDLDRYQRNRDRYRRPELTPSSIPWAGTWKTSEALLRSVPRGGARGRAAPRKPLTFPPVYAIMMM